MSNVRPCPAGGHGPERATCPVRSLPGGCESIIREQFQSCHYRTQEYPSPPTSAHWSCLLRDDLTLLASRMESKIMPSGGRGHRQLPLIEPRCQLAHQSGLPACKTSHTDVWVSVMRWGHGRTPAPAFCSSCGSMAAILHLHESEEALGGRLEPTATEPVFGLVTSGSTLSWPMQVHAP